MKIVADENIPLIHALFSPLGEVITRPGRQISADDVADAEVLLVRSVTNVNEALLNNSAVKFVGTCTIGTDHLDKQYLTDRNIQFSSAPGCNAYGVVQYVFAALAHLGLVDTNLKIGIIGCGNVGGRLYRVLKSAGFHCACYDPFLTKENIADLSSWESLFDCDIICTHTPLTREGPHPTYHMLDGNFISRLKQGAVLLNAGRGEVIDNQALLAHFDSGNPNGIRAVLDVWEPEPELDTQLLEYVSVATPHIAGYSFEGRTNGSLMIYRALADWMGVDEATVSEKLAHTSRKVFGEPQLLEAINIVDAILKTHGIEDDDQHLREKRSNLAVDFDLLRKHYPKRREFSHYVIQNAAPEEKAFYQALGFNVR